jgi:hypothetical protein
VEREEFGHQQHPDMRGYIHIVPADSHRLQSNHVLDRRRHHGRRRTPCFGRRRSCAGSNEQQQGRRREPARVPELEGVLRRARPAGRGEARDHHQRAVPRAAAEPHHQTTSTTSTSRSSSHGACVRSLGRAHTTRLLQLITSWQ